MYEEHPGQCPWFMVYGVSPQSTEERSKEGRVSRVGFVGDDVRRSAIVAAGSKLLLLESHEFAGCANKLVLRNVC